MNVSDRKTENLSFPHELSKNGLSSYLVLLRERILEDNSAPGVVRSFSSSIELEDIDSESLVIFFLGGLDCGVGILGATLGGEGDASINETWPCMYVLSVVIRLLADSMATLKDSRPHESFTNRSSDMNIYLTPFEQSTRRIKF